MFSFFSFPFFFAQCKHMLCSHGTFSLTARHILSEFLKKIAITKRLIINKVIEKKKIYNK